MKILVLNSAILAVDPVDNGDEWATPDQIIPKHVAQGAALVDVDALPDDFAPGRYAFDGGFVRVPGPVVPSEVPDAVSMRQARLALLSAGFLDDVEAVVAAAGRSAQIEWEFAAEVRRDHPLIAVVQSAQALSDAQIDALFVAAAKL